MQGVGLWRLNTQAGSLTCVRAPMVLQGRQREEGIVAGWPLALVGLLPRVQLAVILQGPALAEGAVTQVTLKLPADGGRGQERECGTE